MRYANKSSRIVLLKGMTGLSVALTISGLFRRSHALVWSFLTVNRREVLLVSLLAVALDGGTRLLDVNHPDGDKDMLNFIHNCLKSGSWSGWGMGSISLSFSALIFWLYNAPPQRWPFVSLISRQALRWAVRTTAYAFAAAALEFIALLVGFVLVSLLKLGRVSELVEGMFHDQATAWLLAHPAAAFVIALAVLPSVLVVLRLGVVVAAATAPRALTMVAAWRLTRGAGVAASAGIFMAGIPTFILSLAFNMLSKNGQPETQHAFLLWSAGALSNFFDLLNSLVLLAAMSEIWCAVRSRRPA